MTTLYNLHTDGDHYRITKFVDGEPESSYLVSATDCQCPRAEAGHPSCRHRQMLPDMLALGICNTHYFYRYGSKTNYVTDFQGNHMPPPLAPEGLLVAPPTEPAPAPSWRRL